MQLYVSDFVGDTLLLSTEHIGAYLLLLIALWNANGRLPSDEDKLARVARLSVRRWRQVATDLLPFFEIDGGVLSHHRLTKELLRASETSVSRSISGAKGGKANSLKYNGRQIANATTNAQAGLNHARALPETIKKKEEISVSRGDPPAAGRRLDRNGDAALFQACERIEGKPVPDYLPGKTFSAVTVARAVALLGDADGEAA